MEELRPPPARQPGYGPSPGNATSKSSGLTRLRLRSPQTIVLIAVIVIGLVAAGLLASELYVRHRAESVVAAATECVVHDKASVSFGATPFLLQLASGHYRNISIHTAGNRIGNARGMSPASLAAPNVEERRSELVKLICDIHREDLDVCAAVQRAIRSGVTSTGRLSHLERPLWEFYRYLGRELGLINSTTTLASAG